MIYERVFYMCPKCNQGHFFNKAEGYSTMCPECNIEMRHINTKFVDSEAEKRRNAELDRLHSQPRTFVYCPYCNSVNTSKISTLRRVFSTEFLGLGSSKVGKQWHCNQCGSDF